MTITKPKTDRRRPSPRRMAVLTELYDTLANEWPDADHPHEVPDEWWRETALDINKRYGMPAVRAADLKGWWGSQHLFSPFVDHVAVKHAVQFRDAETITALTDVEWFTFIDTIATLPWPTGEYYRMDTTELADGDDRWHAFQALPANMQQAIERATERALKRVS